MLDTSVLGRVSHPNLTVSGPLEEALSEALLVKHLSLFVPTRDIDDL